MEKWKSLKNIVEYGENYEVSNFGNIRNVKLGKMLKGYDNDGYVMVRFKNKSYLVHRLVALAFIPNLENKPEVNHKDGNKKSNIIGNLEWSTPKENTNHAWNNNLASTRIGEDSNFSKLKEGDVLKIRELFNTGEYTITKISKIYNVSKPTISDIVKRKSWKHI